MSNDQAGNSPAELDEKLAAYWQLVGEREALEARVSKARNEKNSVPERIYQRVLSEYETALESVSRQLKPVQEEIEALRRTLDADVKTLDATIQETEDNIAEARFRHRVGEFDANTLTGVVGRLETALNDARRRRSTIDAQLQAMDRRRTPGGDAPAPAVDPPLVTASAATPPQPQPVSTAAEDADDPLFELKESSMVSGVGAAPFANGDDDDDPLSALSDPSPAGDRAASPRPADRKQTAPGPAAAARATAVAPSYPSLVIRSGVHEGKIVPLLPITMSIGREHDNNIELKDEDVSRYHARIVYEEGRFVIEDLESSSGTWVNGVRQRRAALADGDVVRIGSTELNYEVA